VPNSFSKSISNINWVYWTKWILRWQMEEFGTTSIALAKAVLSLQPWNQHKRFGPYCHLGQMFCLNQLNVCGMWKQTKILTSSNNWHFSVLSMGYLWKTNLTNLEKY
jgi:hypothetical protein